MVKRRRIDVQEVDGAAVVRFRDRKIMDVQDQLSNVQELSDELFALIETSGFTRIVLDFDQVEFLSSAALNRLLFLDKRVKAAGGRLKLCNLGRSLQEVFHITKLDQLFEIEETPEEALASLA